MTHTNHYRNEIIMPRALKVTEESIDHIIAYGKALGFRLDDIRYDLEDACYNGRNLYQITDGTVAYNNVTFSNMIEPDFRHIWKFKTAEMPNVFVEIERV